MEENAKNQNNDDLNRYEAVIVAAKLARKINGLRLAAKEQLAPEELTDIDLRKVTTVALDELNSGKVKYDRKKDIAEESTYDLT